MHAPFLPASGLSETVEAMPLIFTVVKSLQDCPEDAKKKKPTVLLGNSTEDNPFPLFDTCSACLVGPQKLIITC